MPDTLTPRVAHQIEITFAETPYPGDDHIAGYQADEIAAAFRGKHWRNLSPELLHKYRWDIFLLTPEAFRFYAPALMLAALLHHQQVGTVTDNLIFCLTPQSQDQINNYHAGEYNDYFSRRASAFNAAEKVAVLAFLDTFVAVYPLGYLLYNIDVMGSTVEFWRYA
ncbi:MAG: DUF6714 family protein [Anaerolineae bacterium]